MPLIVDESKRDQTPPLELVKNILRQIGQVVNRYPSDVRAATKPGALKDLLGFAGEKEFSYPNGAPPHSGTPTGDKLLNMAYHMAVEPFRDPQGIGLPVGDISKGMISPMAWEAASPQAKEMLNLVKGKFPDFFNKVLKSPQDLISFIMNPEMMPARGAMGTLENVNPLLNRLSIAEPHTKDMATIVHELQHHLNTNRIKNMAPEDAATIGSLLSEVLPPRGQGSLQMRMNQFENYANAPGGVAGSIPGTIRQLPEMKSATDLAQRGMGEEGLSHLAERTVYPSTDPKLLDMANKLGVGVGRLPPNTDPRSLMDEVMNSIAEMQSKGGGEY